MEQQKIEIVTDHEENSKLHFLRNYLSLSIDGGFYIGGLAFVLPQTVLPRVIESLNGPNWLIAILPTLMMFGFLGPPLFVGHYIEQHQRMKPLALWIGIPQRLPYLIAGLILCFGAGSLPSIALAFLVALTPFFSGFFGGISMTSFQELVARTIPANRMPSLWAIRNVMSAVIGIGAGKAVVYILNTWPGTTGYGMLHLITFGFLAVSIVGFAFIKEPIHPPKRIDAVRWSDFVRSIPPMIHKDKRFARYLLCRVFSVGVQIMIPFLSIHTLSLLHKPDSFLGYLVMAQMVGSVMGNVLGGIIGDRHGSKVLMVASNIGFALLCLWSPLAHTQSEFWAIFFLLGLSFGFDSIGVPTFGIGLAPVQKRVAYLTGMSFVTLIALIGAGLISVALQRWFNIFALQSAIAGIFVLVSLVHIIRLQDPRHVRVIETTRIPVVR